MFGFQKNWGEKIVRKNKRKKKSWKILKFFSPCVVVYGAFFHGIQTRKLFFFIIFFPFFRIFQEPNTFFWRWRLLKEGTKQKIPKSSVHHFWLVLVNLVKKSFISYCHQVWLTDSGLEFIPFPRILWDHVLFWT